VQLHLQTRGRNSDYGFLGTSPPEKWWLEFRDLTSFEEPTIIVVGNGSEWRSYLSGIPSARRDRVGTQIRYTVVASGERDGPDEIARLVSAWLGDVAQDSQPGAVQLALDNAFGEVDVERLLDGRSSANQPEVERRLRSALESLPRARLPEPHDMPASWIGAVAVTGATAAFSARVVEIVGPGRAGVAALLNLGAKDDIRPLLDRHGTVAALIDDAELTEIVPLEKKKASIRLPRSQPRNQTSRFLLRLGLLAMAALIVWLVLRH